MRQLDTERPAVRVKGDAIMKSRSSVAFVAVLSCLLLVGALLVGCGGSASQKAATVTESPRSGGTLTVVAQNEPPGIDPHTDWYYSAWPIENQIYESPYGISNKPGSAKTELVPVLAEGPPRSQLRRSHHNHQDPARYHVPAACEPRGHGRGREVQH